MRLRDAIGSVADFYSASCRFNSCRRHRVAGRETQLVEYRTLNPAVAGSTPATLTEDMRV